MVPPIGWKPSHAGWASDGVRFVAKKQPLGLLDGEFRQEMVFRLQVRMEHFVRGEPFSREQPVIVSPSGSRYGVNIRKCQLLLQERGISHFEKDNDWDLCNQLRPVVPYCMWPLTDDKSTQVMHAVDGSLISGFATLLKKWTTSRTPRPLDTALEVSDVHPFQPPVDRRQLPPFWVCIDGQVQVAVVSSGVLHSKVKNKPRTPYLRVQLKDPVTNRITWTHLDEEEIDMYIANGASRESAQLVSDLLLCEVCLHTCAHRVDLSDLEFCDHSPRISNETISGMDSISPCITCSGCEKVVHITCIDGVAQSLVKRGVLNQIKRENLDWFCHDCLSGKCLDDLGTNFGVAMTPKQISRKEYEQFATSNGVSFTNLTINEAEHKFWTMVATGTDKQVLYASDLDAALVSPGPFPKTYFSDAKKSSWDLRQLPLCSESILRYLPESASIAGVSRPWMYLGSPGSAFCWHTEDHFLCSVSYMHEGAPKVWYSVPGNSRLEVNAAIKKLLPDLSRSDNLLHRLVTLVNPKTLAQRFRIPVSRAVQNENEFIITFPEAYHCGFNLGVNLAEAVNVAYSWWLAWGLEPGTGRPAVVPIERLVWNIIPAIVDGSEKDPVVRLQCLAYLERTATSIHQKTRELSMVEVDEQNIMEDILCIKCHQFCFLGHTPIGEPFCMYCAPLKAQFNLKVSQKRIRNAIALLEANGPTRIVSKRKTANHVHATKHHRTTTH